MKQIIAFYLFLTSICFSQGFWEMSLDIPEGGEWLNGNSLATDTDGNLYALSGYDCTEVECSVALLFSDDNGKTWVEKSIFTSKSSFDMYHLSINTQGDIFAWAGDRPPSWIPPIGGTILRSTDSGDNWSLLSQEQCFDLTVNSIGEIFCILWYDVYRSLDNGDSWENINIGNEEIVHLIINKEDKVNVISREGKLYQSTDNGDNWTSINSAWTSLSHPTLAINSNDDIFVTGESDDGKVIYRSQDMGNTWTELTKILENGYPENNLFIDSEDNIYIYSSGKHCTETGIYLSTDNGNSWSELKSGLTSLFVDCLLQSVDGYIFTGTHEGVFRSVNPITNVKENDNHEELPTSIQLSQNYPNPYNPSTTINYSIPKQSNVTLKVFDVLGSEVATLVNKEQPQGNYEVELNGSELTSGIYFYRLQVYAANGGAGDPSTSSGQGFVETKKMILLR